MLTQGQVSNSFPALVRMRNPVLVNGMIPEGALDDLWGAHLRSVGAQGKY